MKSLFRLLWLIPLTLAAQTPEWKAAAAKVAITPQETMYLSGASL